MTNKLKYKYLIDMANIARNFAYAPYSSLKVGAAVLVGENKVFTGSNIENISYGLTICAERTAIFNAVSNGYKNILEIAVIADTKEPIVPCGACLQVLTEFGSDTRIIMANTSGDISTIKLNKLLTLSFKIE